MMYFRVAGYVVLMMSALSAGYSYAQVPPSPDGNAGQNQAFGHNPSIRDIAPIRLYDVPEISVAPPVPLPDIDPASAESAATDSAVSDSAATDSAASNRDSSDPDPIESPLSDSAPANAPESPMVNFSGEWRPDPSRAWSTSRSHVGFGRTADAEAFNNRTSWLNSIGSNRGWTLGADNWHYTQPNGVGVTVGNDLSSAPAWGQSARLGGVRFSQSLSDAKAAHDEWQYSVMVGKLDYSPTQQAEGGLVYGPAASNTVVRYGLSPQLTLESQVQSAPNLLTTGIGGEYDTRGWGAWKLGVARASQDLYHGLRYEVGYEVNVLDAVKLSWVNEQRTGGFSDLSRYQGFSLDSGRSRNQWGATLPMGRWGDLMGTYEEVAAAAGPIKQQFGVTQQFWYSPNLRIGVNAQREIITGSYDVGLRFSIPIK